MIREVFLNNMRSKEEDQLDYSALIDMLVDKYPDTPSASMQYIVKELRDNDVAPEEAVEAVSDTMTELERLKHAKAEFKAVCQVMKPRIDPFLPEQKKTVTNNPPQQKLQPAAEHKQKPSTTCRVKVFEDQPARRNNEKENETVPKGLFQKIMSRLRSLRHNPYREL